MPTRDIPYDKKEPIILASEEIIAPEGYRFTSMFQYPQKVLLIVESVSLVITTILYLLALQRVIVPEMFVQLQGWQANMVGFIVFSSPYMVYTIHGLLQRGLCLLRGYPISFFLLFFLLFEGSFPVAPGQFQSYRDALFIAVTHISLYLFLLIPLLMTPHGIIGVLLAYFLIMNLFISAVDIPFIFWLLRKSRGAVLYVESRTVFLFEPMQEG